MNSSIRSAVLRLASSILRNDGGKIVFYHDVFHQAKYYEHALPIDLFREHILEARRIGFTHVSSIPNERRTFHVCFDDGYRGVWECRDALEELGIKPTIYLAVALIGKPGFLSKSEILDLQKDGYNFQSHTWSHEYLPRYNDTELKHELDDSRKWLSDFLGKDVDQICFPRGLFTRKVYDASMAAGYSYMISSIPGATNQVLMPRLVPRNLVQGYSSAEFGYVLKGGLSPFRRKYYRRHFHI